MKISIKTSGDGSHTLCREDLNETYHSIHGAVQESRHVFINAGLNHFKTNNKSIDFKILEVGFGTGLNALLSLEYLKYNQNLKIDYSGFELFPLDRKITEQLNYTDHNESLQKLKNDFDTMHLSKWNLPIQINKGFNLTKIDKSILTLERLTQYDIVYYDAFAPQIEPTLWTVSIFKKIYNATKKGGVFVTYCAKGQVRRDLESVGFKMERIPGPPGKREMLRGTKL